MKNGNRPLEHPEHDHGFCGSDGTLTSSDPGWFLQTSLKENPGELMERYRASRNLPEPSSHPRPPRTAASRAYRELIESQAQPPAGFLGLPGTRQNPDANISKGKAVEPGLRKTFIMAAVLASASGAVVGFTSSQIGEFKASLAGLVSGSPLRSEVAAPPPKQQLQIASSTVIAKKPIATATLNVADLSGETNSLIPLGLHAEPALQGQDLLLKISGLPENAYLTAGQRQSDKIWTLTLADLGNAKLMIPKADQNNISVAVAAFEPETGELAAPIKTMQIALSDVMVEPASAPPPASPSIKITQASTGLSQIPQPKGGSLTQEANRQAAAFHLEKGQELFKSGDIAGARAEFETAWNSGSPDGALGLARSFDPVFLAGLGFSRSDTDSSRAIQWYERAAIAGKDEAQSAIIRLRMKPN